MDKYKSLCDNNNRTERERKTFKHYEHIHEFMNSSDKVNPRFVNETKAHKHDCSDDTDDNLSTRNQDCGLKLEKRPATSAEGDTADAKKKLENGQNVGKGPKQKKKRLSGDDMELAILDMMKFQRNPSKDLRRTREFFKLSSNLRNSILDTEINSAVKLLQSLFA